jgi:uncharacterized membrane protein
MSASEPAAPRAHFVDLLRLVMSVQMIAGHTIDALLARELRAGPVFDAWTWVRGLTAVGFLVAAGVSFHLSSLSRWDAYREDRASRRRRARRALALIAIGYLLHAPAGALSGDPEVARRAIEEAQIVDVLQCIGVTLLALEAASAIAKSARAAVLLAAALAIATIALAPLAAALDCEASGARAACNYLSRTGGSLFPLLPWSGFVLAGVVAAALALPEGARTPPLRSAGRLALLAGLAIVASLALEIAWEPPRDPLTYSAWPPFSLARLAWVLAIAAALAAASHAITALPRALRTLAAETLFLYVTHLLALYGMGVGLSRWIGPTLAVGPAVLVALAMITASSFGALAWARWKRARDGLAPPSDPAVSRRAAPR